jgi:hypothetical protein
MHGITFFNDTGEKKARNVPIENMTSLAQNRPLLFSYAKFLKASFLKMNISLSYGCFSLHTESNVSKSFVKIKWTN